MTLTAIEHGCQFADGDSDWRTTQLLVQALVLAEAVGQAHDGKSGTVFQNCSLLLP
jgi:hypothetical protein